MDLKILHRRRIFKGSKTRSCCFVLRRGKSVLGTHIERLLERLEKYAGQIYNTAEVGAVGMEVGKGKIKIFCYRERES